MVDPFFDECWDDCIRDGVPHTFENLRERYVLGLSEKDFGDLVREEIEAGNIIYNVDQYVLTKDY